MSQHLRRMIFRVREQFSWNPVQHPHDAALIFANPSSNPRLAEMFHRGNLHFDEAAVTALAHHFEDVFGGTSQMEIVIKLAVEARGDGVDSIEFLRDSGSVDVHADVSL